MKSRAFPLILLGAILCWGCTGGLDSTIEPQNLVSCFDTASGIRCVATPDAIHYEALDANGDGIEDLFLCADADSANDNSNSLRGDDNDEDTDGDTDEDGDTDDDDDTDEDGDTDDDDDSDSDSDSDCDSDSDSDSEDDGDSDSDAEGDADKDGVGNQDDCDSMMCEPEDEGGDEGGDGDGEEGDGEEGDGEGDGEEGDGGGEPDSGAEPQAE